MKFKFLVLLAVLCLSVLVSAHDDKKDKKPSKAPKAPKVVEIEEVRLVRKAVEQEAKNEKSRKVEIKKEVRKKPPKLIPCSEAVLDNKQDCEKNDIPKGYKPIFTWKDNEDCDWECNYQALPTVAPPPKEKKVVVVRKAVKEPKQKKERKECSGEESFVFTNCLVKVRGLMAWGDKTRNFDKKFDRLIKKKKVKAAGPAKKPAKKNAKKPAKKDAKKPAAAKKNAVPAKK